MRNTAAYLYGQYWPNESGFLGGKMTGAEMQARAREHLLASLGKLYDMSSGESHSTTYVPVHLYTCYALYECATDPEMKAAADAALHFYVANDAANRYEGVIIAPASRDKPGSRNANTYINGQTLNMRAISWLYWADAQNWDLSGIKNNNINSSGRLPEAALSRWRPSAAIASLARGQTVPYELTSSTCGHPRTNKNPSMQILTPAAVVRYVYRDKLYAMGSGHRRYNLE